MCNYNRIFQYKNRYFNVLVNSFQFKKKSKIILHLRLTWLILLYY